ncbi:YceI family protein [Pedobacter frigiditerrae]|uniref:YceI family protein n=1 Tax=Pedobacter frigiditerrae TaxID=2530452 RepID=A0A4R0MWL8_9SPHI|nr:YceI family protein [Pedobacter frigiditerrae]TCC90334.1 YceI family protein [Pedobacter frigiditerrae]
MINKITIILLLFSLSFSATAQKSYSLDIKKSKISWKIETVGKHNGQILFSWGKLDYSPKGEPTAASFIMDMNKMTSLDRPTEKGRAEIDTELRSPGFFDVAVYPTATMIVKQILKTPTPNVFRVTGDLTIKGITHRIEFNAAIVKKGELITAKANFNIARKKWNIDFKEKPNDWDFTAAIKNKMIDDDIQISLDLTFGK